MTERVSDDGTDQKQTAEISSNEDDADYKHKKKKKKTYILPRLLTELEKKNNALRLMNIKDRLTMPSIHTRLALVEKEVLTEPLIQWERHFLERERYDVTKPVPYDKHEAYE